MKVLCKVCGSTSVAFYFTSSNVHGRHIVDIHDKFKVVKCNDCDAVFVKDVVVDKKYYEKYYQLGYYDQPERLGRPIVRILKLLSNLSIAKKEALILKSLGQKKKIFNLLDIGCGSGNFLASLKSSRIVKYGNEINKEALKICRKRGLRVFGGELNKLRTKGLNFDAITLWQVLEHIDKPAIFLKRINGLLKKSGILVFQTPNSDGTGFKIGKNNWFHLDSPRHLILYNRKSVLKLCEITGFKVINIKNEFYDYPLDLFWSVRFSFFKFLIYPFYPIFKIYSREHLTYVCKKI